MEGTFSSLSCLFSLFHSSNLLLSFFNLIHFLLSSIISPSQGCLITKSLGGRDLAFLAGAFSLFCCSVYSLGLAKPDLSDRELQPEEIQTSAEPKPRGKTNQNQSQNTRKSFHGPPAMGKATKRSDASIDTVIRATTHKYFFGNTTSHRYMMESVKALGT
ncbi:hypothetical protein V2G26_003205 [Clonostachys chloroleuca]